LEDKFNNVATLSNGATAVATSW